MLSAVQAVSQVHTGGVSVLSSAKAAVGSSVSTIQHISRMLSSRFFIVIPRFLLAHRPVPRGKRVLEQEGIASGYIPMQGSTPLQYILASIFVLAA